MSYSAQTEKLRLPQWVQGSKDHPDFLTDVNQAFEKIDVFAQGIDNTVHGLPEQAEEVATILQSVQEDVGEHTEELARQGVRIGVLETDVAEIKGVAGRVGNLENWRGAVDPAISLANRIAHEMTVTADVFCNGTLGTANAKTVPITLSRSGLFIAYTISADSLRELINHFDIGNNHVIHFDVDVREALKIPADFTFNSITATYAIGTSGVICRNELSVTSSGEIVGGFVNIVKGGSIFAIQPAKGLLRYAGPLEGGTDAESK